MEEEEGHDRRRDGGEDGVEEEVVVVGGMQKHRAHLDRRCLRDLHPYVSSFCHHRTRATARPLNRKS